MANDRHIMALMLILPMPRASMLFLTSYYNNICLAANFNITNKISYKELQPSKKSNRYIKFMTSYGILLGTF